jgi:putative FmdB family regulatory protein
MSYYAYRCPNGCGDFSQSHRMGLAPQFAECPKCHTQSRRLITVPGIAFKGRGWTRGMIDPFCHSDGSPLTESDKNRTPPHYENK